MDQQLQDLVDQMRDLVRTLKSTSGTAGTGTGMGDRAVTQLINALGQLSTKLDGTTRTRAEEMQAMKRFAANVNRATTQQEKQQQAIDKNLQRIRDEAEARKEAARLTKMSAEELAAYQRQQRDKESKALNNLMRDRVEGARRDRSSSRDVFDALNSTGGSVELLKGKFLDLGGNSLAAQAGLQLFASGLEGVTKSLTNYSSALYKGERGAKVSAKALTDLAEPVLKTIDVLGNLVSFASIFVPGGMLVKGAVALGGVLISAAAGAGKLALKFNELAADQADALFKSFKEISQVGAATAGGMDDVFSNLQTLGMTVSEIEEYNKLIVSSGQKLGLLGATAAEGKQAFADVAGSLVKSELGRQLEMLGITAGEQREAALSYMSIQARTGQMELKNTRTLVEESAKFAKELDLSARLTGQTRKEQEAAREANMAESRYRAALFAAQQRGDQGEIARLEKAGSMAAMLRGMGLTELATGTIQYAAGGGAMATPEAIQAGMSLGLSQVLNDPNISAVQALQQGLGTAKQQLGQLAETNKYMGEVAAIQPNIPKTLDAIARLENIQKAAIKEGMTVEQFLNTKQGQQMMAGGNTKLMVDAGRQQQSAAMLMDSAVETYNGAAKIHDAAATTFKNAVEIFAKAVGAKTPAGGTYTGASPSMPAVATPTTAQIVAKETRELANVKAEQTATAIDAEKEAKQELEILKKKNASAEEQQKAQEKLTQAVKTREQLEQEEIKAAREARQRALEAKNQRQRERREAAGVKAPATTGAGAPPTAAPASVPAAGTAPGKVPPGTPVAPKPATAVVGAGPGFTTVQTTDGDNQRREGVRNWRNNNPGNIEYGKFSQSMGAIGTDGRFAVFPTIDAGHKAKEELLFGARSNYVNLSIADAITRYAPPTENNTRAYINAVTGAVGVNDSTILAQLSSTDRSKFLDAINKMEGFKEGKVVQANGGAVARGPKTGYAATLHGWEAVVPLPDGQSIPVQFKDIQPGQAGTDPALLSAVSALNQNLSRLTQPMGGSNDQSVALLSELVNLQRTSNSTSQRMLQVTQA
jgi:hypothetical protein